MLNLEIDRLFGTDGSGNQKKVWIGNNLVKLDSKFRESQKEVSASILGKAFGLNVVEYRRSRFIVNGKECIGCYCKNYLSNNETTISAVDILNYFDVNIENNMSAVDYFNITLDCIQEYTKLNKTDVQLYMMQMLVFDFIIANSDRHLTNFEFIKGNGYFRFTPLYDHGESFFCKDTILTTGQIENESRKFKSKPFSSNPKKNLIDIDLAKYIANQFKEYALKRYEKLSDIPMLESHNKIMRYRLDKLLNMKK